MGIFKHLSRSNLGSVLIDETLFLKLFFGVMITLWFWGGGAPGIAKVFLFFASGVLFILRPLRYWPPKWVMWLMGILFLWNLLPLMPVHPNGIPSWKIPLLELGIPIGAQITPQPWITLAASLEWMLAGMWVLWLMDLDVDDALRERSLFWFSRIIALLALGILIASELGLKNPFAQEVHCFSYFPNRNQTSSLMMLGGVTALGLIMVRRRLHRSTQLLMGFFWLICFFAVMATLSRAGLLLFVLGSFIAVVFRAILKGYISLFTLFMPFAFLIFALFLLLGKSIWMRWIPTSETVGLFSLVDFRWSIWRDCWPLITENSLTGIGLGQFEWIFPFYRDHSLAPTRIVHPENDAVWILIEQGLPGLLLTLGILAHYLWRVFPFDFRHRADRYRMVALLCVSLFLLHTLVDVGGHRSGLFLPVAFLLSLAVNPKLKQGRLLSVRLQRITRFAGVFLTVIGALWLGSHWMGWRFQPESACQLFEQATQQDIAISEKLSLIDDWKELTPLDWKPYFIAARAYQNQGPSYWGLALNDFRRVHALEPDNAAIAFAEGESWLGLDLSLTLSAWNRALSGSSINRDSMLLSMVAWADRFPVLWPGLETLTQVYPELQGWILAKCPQAHFCRQIAAFIRNGQWMRTSESQRRILLKRWINTECGESIAPIFVNADTHPDQGWWLLKAFYWGNKGEYALANEVIVLHLPVPSIPEIQTSSTIEKLKADFYSNSQNLLSGIALFRQYMDRQDFAQALTILERIQQRKHVDSVWAKYWNARLTGTVKSPELAWPLWQRYFIAVDVWRDYSFDTLWD
jgi:hypothetical protein